MTRRSDSCGRFLSDDLNLQVAVRDGEVVQETSTELPTLSNENVRELQEIFYTYCSKNDGRLSEAEFFNACTCLC